MTFVVTKIDASKCVIRVTQLFKLCIHEKDKNKSKKCFYMPVVPKGISRKVFLCYFCSPDLLRILIKFFGAPQGFLGLFGLGVHNVS